MARPPRFLSRLVDKVVPDVIKRLTSDEPADAPAGQGGGQTQPSTFDEEPPELTLEDILKEDIGAFGGKMHIISLVEFKEAIGSARWLKLSTNIMMIAEGVLRSRLGHAHAYAQRGTDMFVLGFRHLSDGEAKNRAIMVAEEIGGRLAGANFGGKQALVRVAEIAPEDLLGEGEGLDEDALHAAVADGQAVTPTADNGSAAAHFWSSRPPEKKPQRLLPTVDPTALHQPERRYWHQAALPDREESRRAWATSGAGADYDDTPAEDPVAAAAREAAQAPRWEPLVKPLSEAERRHFEEMHGGLLATLSPQDYLKRGTLDATEEASPAPAPLPPEDPEPEVDAASKAPGAVDLTLRPCWTLATEAADTFLLRPVLTGGSIPAGETREPAALHDPLIAAEAVKALAAMAGAGNKAVLVVPLHAVSLAGERRAEVLRALCTAPQSQRMLQLRVELVGITPNTRAATVTAAVQALHPVVREIALRTPLLEPARAVFGIKGVLVGADLDTVAAADRHPERLAAALRQLEEKARLGGATGTFAWGLKRRQEIAAALNAGIRQVGGNAFSKDIPLPGRIVRLPKGKLLGTL